MRLIYDRSRSGPQLNRRELLQLLRVADRSELPKSLEELISFGLEVPLLHVYVGECVLNRPDGLVCRVDAAATFRTYNLEPIF